MDRTHPYRRTPQFGAAFCVASTLWAALAALVGCVFNILAARKWGRKLLLAHPSLFSCGVFSEEGPSEATLAATSW